MLDAVAREPAEGCALEAMRLGLVDGEADREGVAEVDVRQLEGCAADDRHVAGVQGPAEAGVCGSLTRHERMFACPSLHEPHHERAARAGSGPTHEAEDARDVAGRLAVGGDAAAGRDGARAGVVGGERERH